MPERGDSLRHRTRWRLVAAAAIGALVGAALTFAVTALYDGTDRDAYADRVAELQAQEAARHAEQVIDLNEAALAAHAELLPMLAELHDVLPVEGPAVDGDAPDVAEWRAAVDRATTAFGEPPSASTDYNMARNGLLLSIDLLDSALVAYDAAVRADGEQQAVLEELASDMRRRAVDAWSVAATHLDVLNIDAGHGHVHVYLPLRPGDDVGDPNGHGDDH